MPDNVGSLFGQMLHRLNKLNLAKNPNLMRKAVNDALSDAGLSPLDENVALSRMTAVQYKAVLENLPPAPGGVGGAA